MSAIMTLATATLALTLSAPATVVFPTALAGQWTDTPSACGGEDTGGMRVSAGTIAFYEAVGTPTALRVSNDGTIIANLSYTGEGKTWTEVSRFKIAPDQKSLRVSALSRTFTLNRCPTP